MILAALAGVAIPGFTRAKQRGSASQAISYLRTIRTSEKMYYAKWGTYLAGANSDAIKAALGAESNTADYDFSVTAPTATTFTATATKGAAANFISLNQDGTWTSGGDQTKYQPAS